MELTLKRGGGRVWEASVFPPSLLARTSLVAQMIKNLTAIQETRVRSLGREIPWRREWQPSPVFLTGESHGQRSLAGYSPWGCKESDMTDQLIHTYTQGEGSSIN